MVTPCIAVSGLGVVRGRVNALDDVSFGEVVGLLGPSGCGKSTLMRAVVGVQRISSGGIVVLGEAAGSASLRSRVGYVTQAASVYEDLTVAENLRFFAAVLGVGSQRVDECVAVVDLRPQRDQLVARLSGGQRSRVSLAVALLGNPKVLVLDEPTVGLDPVLRRDLWATFHSLADSGAAVLVSSHVMDEATRCDRLLVLREGRLIVDQTPSALLESTGTDDVDAAFLAIVEASS
jgi:ABC-2 type transport system ATP-binding protein